MDPVNELIAIESVKRTQAKYWFNMDTKNLDGFTAVFCDDAIFDMREERAFALGESVDDLPPVADALAAGEDGIVSGGRVIAEFILGLLTTWVTVHHGHAPIIEVVADDRATGIWPMFDYIDDGERSMKGYGHYHVDYRLVDDEWRISQMRLVRIRADGEHPGQGQL